MAIWVQSLGAGGIGVAHRRWVAGSVMASCGSGGRGSPGHSSQAWRSHGATGVSQHGGHSPAMSEGACLDRRCMQKVHAVWCHRCVDAAHHQQRAAGQCELRTLQAGSEQLCHNCVGNCA